MNKFLLSAILISAFMNTATGETFPDVTSITVNGTVAPAGGVALENAGNGIWSRTVSLDRPCDGDYHAHCIWFSVNDSIDFKRCWGSRKLTRDVPGALCEGIRLNNGTYTISVDTSDFTYSVSAPVDSSRVSVFGSSVANGEGATGKYGYARQLGDQLTLRYEAGETQRPMHISGVSIGGNTTTALLNRYDDLLNDFGHYAVIGLSMGNEGIHEASDKEKVFSGFRDNMLSLITRIKADGKIPVVVNNYTRADYTPEDYAFIKRINMLIHEWDVASVNSLGAIDDGQGRWAEGYQNDPGHPNTEGHREFMHAFVPSLFDAIADGKPQPQRDTTGCLTLTKKGTLHIVPESILHPFTITLRVRGNNIGKILSITSPQGNAEIICNRNGSVTYTAADGSRLTSAQGFMSDGEWHDITLTHYHARGCSMLYADTESCGQVQERISPQRFVIGDSSKRSSRDISEISLWRAGMTDLEISAHHEGAMLKSSLEIYSPMKTIEKNAIVTNLAQSHNTISYCR